MRKAITTTLSAGFALAGFTGITMAQDIAAASQPPVETYICERNVELQVVYINNLKNDEAMAVLFTEGKLVPMRIAVSGSGARYVAYDEQDSYRWHTKGGEGVLSYMEADHTAEEQVLLSNCVNKANAPEQD